VGLDVTRLPRGARTLGLTGVAHRPGDVLALDA